MWGMTSKLVLFVLADTKIDPQSSALIRLLYRLKKYQAARSHAKRAQALRDLVLPCASQFETGVSTGFPGALHRHGQRTCLLSCMAKWGSSDEQRYAELWASVNAPADFGSAIRIRKNFLCSVLQTLVQRTMEKRPSFTDLA